MSETTARVGYEQTGGIAVLTLDDPPANTYTYEMMRQLDDAVLRARFDESVHVIVLRGRGEKFFCAGANINMLREAEVSLSRGRKLGEVCRALGILEQSYYRWRSEYGGMKLVQVKRLKELEKENAQLKRAVAELTLDKLILKEAAEGNF